MIFIKELPKVYQNKIGIINNNKEVFYDKLDNNKEEKVKPKEEIVDLDIESKIINIFKNSNNVYKVKTEIKLKNGTMTKYIVGRIPGKVITLDNDSIPLEDIIDIKAVD